MPDEPWRELVSPKVGLIRSFAPQPRAAEEPQPPYLYTATLSHFDLRMADASERIGAGKGRTEAEAIVSAIGEAVERYCAFHWNPDLTFLAKWCDVRPAAVSPAECVLYSERQYNAPEWPYTRWREDGEVTWVRGVEVHSAQNVALPASLVYLVHPVPRIEDHFASSTSNGLAAGPSLAAAAFGGMCELMERDAMLIAWMNRLPAIELDLAESGPTAASLQKHYARLSVEVRAFLLPSDLPAATVLAVAFDEDPARPAQVVGMGCHPDPGIALTKALFELCQGRPAEAKRFTDKPPAGRLNEYEDVKTLDDHSAFASQRERRGEFAFLWQSGQKARVADLPNRSCGDAVQDLDACARALAELGHRTVYADLTLPDVGPHGFHVARTIITGLQPIHFGHGLERFGGRRLFELPYKLGFANEARTAADLNPCPHPLA